MEWQPIETAPKDGSRILVFTDRGATALVEWVGKRRNWCGVTDERFSGYEQDGKFYSYWFIDPTIWMPLPDPPA